MNRDWSEVKGRFPDPYEGNNSMVKLTLEAIAEIEQLRRENKLVLDLAELLRQDKAELVEMLKSVSQHTGYIDLINDELEAILAKHGGEPNES